MISLAIQNSPVSKVHQIIQTNYILKRAYKFIILALQTQQYICVSRHFCRFSMLFLGKGQTWSKVPPPMELNYEVVVNDGWMWLMHLLRSSSLLKVWVSHISPHCAYIQLHGHHITYRTGSFISPGSVMYIRYDCCSGCESQEFTTSSNLINHGALACVRHQ